MTIAETNMLQFRILKRPGDNIMVDRKRKFLCAGYDADEFLGRNLFHKII